MVPQDRVFADGTSLMSGYPDDAERLLIYDATPPRGDAWLRRSWAVGARLYRSLGRVDAVHGATSWGDAFRWLARRPSRPIRELQYWGHGRWGRVMIGNDIFSEESLCAGHPHFTSLEALGERWLPDAGSLVWFRTCETFGAERGKRFAQRLTDTCGVRAAGHTYVIGVLQSGLHGLGPGVIPRWPSDEGLKRGTGAAPTEAWPSSASAPHTIHFMNGSIPSAWFER